MKAVYSWLLSGLAIFGSLLLTVLLFTLVVHVLPDTSKESAAFRDSFSIAFIVLVWLPLSIFCWYLVRNRFRARAAWRDIKALGERIFG